MPVIGILTKWISVRLKPMEIPAKPFGAFSLVEPKITSRKIKVNTTSAMNADTMGYPPIEASAKPFCPKPFLAKL